MNIQDAATGRNSKGEFLIPAADLLKLLGNPHRLGLLCSLLHGEHSVGALTREAGLRQSALSQHLARLRHAGLVATRKDAQVVYYRLASEEVERLIALLHELYCGAPGTGGARRKGRKRREPDAA